MPCSFPVARDEMFALVNDGWLANAGGAELRFMGAPAANPPDPTQLYGRLSTRNVTRPQTAFVGLDPGPTLRQHTTFGILTLEVFSPLSMTGYQEGLELCDAMLGVVTNEQTASGVTLRNCVTRELASDGKSYRFTVTAQYDFASTNPIA